MEAFSLSVFKKTVSFCGLLYSAKLINSFKIIHAFVPFTPIALMEHANAKWWECWRITPAIALINRNKTKSVNVCAIMGESTMAQPAFV